MTRDQLRALFPRPRYVAAALLGVTGEALVMASDWLLGIPLSVPTPSNYFDD